MLKATKKASKIQYANLYPCLMSCDDEQLIVLMTSSGQYAGTHSGVVVYSELVQKVGHTSNTWSPSFIPYTGEVTIESIK